MWIAKRARISYSRTSNNTANNENSVCFLHQRSLNINRCRTEVRTQMRRESKNYEPRMKHEPFFSLPKREKKHIRTQQQRVELRHCERASTLIIVRFFFFIQLKDLSHLIFHVILFIHLQSLENRPSLPYAMTKTKT